MTEAIMSKLIDKGAKRWTKGGKDRLYLNGAVAQIIGLEVSYYKSGNVSSATLKGEDISNSKANKIMLDAGSIYIDLTTGEFRSNGCHELVEEIRAWIKAEEVSETEEAETSAEIYEVEFSAGESRRVIVNRIIDERAIVDKDACNYMLCTVKDKDGDEQELYAEVAVSEIYDSVEDYDEDDFDKRAYPMLIDEIVKQAAEYGITRDRLRFWND